ncbi:MAG: hypothetical protein H7Z40_04245, partial [Phycisphaerae bacterium]|nr:hypothetical protein [Gemmatimonadaceae bacterium]
MRDELWVSVVMAGILSLSSLARADAQTGAQRAAGAVNVVPIGPANATLNEEFSRLLSLRELSGGRVLLTDGKEKRVIVADFAANSVRLIGRAGDGPDEYRQVGRLWDIGGDSTFMSVPYASRWLVLHQDSIVHTFTGQLPIILKVGATVVRGADSQGNVLTIAWMVRTSDKYRTMPDSFTYVRTNRTSLKVDTVLKVVNSDKDIVIVPRAAVGTATPSPDKRQYSLALEARDQLAVFKDGTVAVLRGNPYRIDWCLQPGKPCAMGAPLAREVRSWRVADKSAYLKAMNALSAWPPTENIDQ